MWSDHTWRWEYEDAGGREIGKSTDQIDKIMPGPFCPTCDSDMQTVRQRSASWESYDADADALMTW